MNREKKTNINPLSFDKLSKRIITTALNAEDNVTEDLFQQYHFGNLNYDNENESLKRIFFFIICINTSFITIMYKREHEY